jgi:hypothetical protein
MTGFVYVYPTAEGERYTLVRGPLRDWLKAESIPALRSITHKGWHVRTERIGDLIARAEHAGYEVRMKGQVTPR